jgi:hypothetical protein
MKAIDDHFLLNSLSKFVKVVEKDNKVKAKLQIAILASLNKESKKNLNEMFRTKHKSLFRKMRKYYKEMIEQFSLSQETLNTTEFSVNYDKFTY